MNTLKKIDEVKRLLAQHENMFMCPICKNEMSMNEGYSLVCSNRHCFDLAKQGYINLLTKAVKVDYEQDMLQSRRSICKEGFYNPLIDTLGEMIAALHSDNDSERLSILDAGCGEGSHLIHTVGNLEQRGIEEITGVGIDISKYGVQIAARECPELIWCVADLAKLPFKAEQFDIILNILSPSNYAEFKRVLTPTGVIIKVIPEENYLKELREHFYQHTEKQSYSNEKVVKHFEESFGILEQKRITYRVDLNHEMLEDLVKMTPLSWGAAAEDIEKILALGLDEVTVDLRILTGKKTS